MTNETNNENATPSSSMSTSIDKYLLKIKDLMTKFSNLPVFKPATGESTPWGYDLYPERKELFKPKLENIVKMKEGREFYAKNRCEEKVYGCVKNSSLVKLMMAALRSSGWYV